MPAVEQSIARATGELAEWSGQPDGWGHGELATRTGRVGIVGTLVGARRGDTVEVVGIWEDHPRFGKRLKFRSCSSALPETSAGIVAWMVSTLPDIGEGRARKLIERFGDDLWKVIETAHEALATVEGITPRRADAIHAAYLANRALRDDMVALRGWGLTDKQVARCIEQWGELSKVVERVRTNPYELSQHVHGFGFKRADVVAIKSGMAHNAPERLCAGIEHVLEDAAAAGHCFLWGGGLKALAVELLQVGGDAVTEAIRAAVKDGRVIWRDKRIYSRRMDAAEQQCAAALKRLLGVRA